MAPERHFAEPLTAAVDQFAFCVSLWEAIVGHRPFTGRRLGHKKKKGPPPWPSDAGPQWLGEVLRRGMAPVPADRWPTMGALLVALSTDPRALRRKRLRLWGGITLGGFAAAGAYAAGGDRAGACTGAAKQLEREWNPKARDRLQEQMTSVPVAYAGLVWARTEERLDAYTTEWASSYRAACEASERREQSPALMDLRVECLDRGRKALGATMHALGTADVGVLENAESLLDALPNLARCSDLAALREGADPPRPEDVQPLADAREAVTTARIARIAGRLDDAEKNLERARVIVGQVAYLPSSAEFYLENGRYSVAKGAPAEAEASFRRALHDAS